MTVWRVLKKYQVKAVVKRCKKSDYIRYSKTIPGERVQQTDKTAFWNLIDLPDKTLDLNATAMEWQEFYDKKRPHSSLNGKTPMQKLKSVEHLISI